jgi:hypothetical protein
MPAWKALLFVIVVGAIGAFVLFWAVPSTQPAIVKAWFRSAKGLKPAKTPNECMDRFAQCIRKRDYETAADLYCGGDYREQLQMGAKAGTQLGEAIDDLWNAAFDVTHLNAPVAKTVLILIDPFPKEVKVKEIKHKDGEDRAEALITIGLDQLPDLGEVKQVTGWDYDSRIERSLLSPDLMVNACTPGLGGHWVELRNEGEKEKSWKVYFPVTSDIPVVTGTAVRPGLSVLPGLRDKVDYVRKNYGNYVQAMKNLKYAVKHEAVAKSEFESQLRNELSKAK